MAGNLMTVISGLGYLSTQFEKLSADIALITSRRMVAAAGGILKKEAKAIAESKGIRKTGALIRNIAIKRETRSSAGMTQYHLGVRHGRALGNGKKVIKYLEVGKRGRVVTRRENDPFYWSYHEFGTRNINARPFIQPALENKRMEAIAAMEDRLNKDLAKAQIK